MDASDLSYSGRLPTIKPLGRLLLQCSTLSAETNLVLSTVPDPDVDERPRFSFPPSLSTVIGLSNTHLAWLGSNEHNLPNRKNLTLLDPPHRIVRTPRMSSSPLGSLNTGDSSWDNVVEGKIKSWIREELLPNLDDVLFMAEPRNGQRGEEEGVLLIRRTLKFKVSRNKAKLELIFKELNINTVAELQEALMNL